MTIDEVADYCEFRNCSVRLGDSSVGYIRIDGTGIRLKENNYRRFLAQNELAALPSPRNVLEKATVFNVERGSEVQRLGREEFERELRRFQEVISA